MSTTEVIRHEQGPGRGLIAGVTDGKYTQKVIRDRNGYITGTEGRTRTDDLADRISDLERIVVEAVDADDDGLTRDELDAALATLPAGVTRAELTTALSELRKTLPQGVTTADIEAKLGAMRKQIRSETLREQGWEPSDKFLINSRNISVVASRFGVTWPVNIAWMTARQQIEVDHEWGTAVRAYCDLTGESGQHTIRLRKGSSTAQIEASLRHELAHCMQIEQLGEYFDAAYSHPAAREYLEGHAVRKEQKHAEIQLVREP